MAGEMWLRMKRTLGGGGGGDGLQFGADLFFQALEVRDLEIRRLDRRQYGDGADDLCLVDKAASRDRFPRPADIYGKDRLTFSYGELEGTVLKFTHLVSFAARAFREE